MKNAFLKKSLNPIGYRYDQDFDIEKAWAGLVERRYTKERGRGWRSPVHPFHSREFCETEFFFGEEFLLMKYQVNVVPSVQSWVSVAFEQLLMKHLEETGKEATAGERREFKITALDITLKNFPRKPIMMDLLVDIPRKTILICGGNDKTHRYALEELSGMTGIRPLSMSNWNLENLPDISELRSSTYRSKIQADPKRTLWEPVLSEFLTWMFYNYMRKPEFSLDVSLPLVLADNRNIYRYSGKGEDTAGVPELFTGLLHGSTMVGIRLATRGEENAVSSRFNLSLEPRSLKILTTAPKDNVYAWLYDIADRFHEIRDLIRELWVNFLSIRKDDTRWGRECGDVSRTWRKALKDIEEENL